VTTTLNSDVAVVDRKSITCHQWQTSTRSCRLTAQRSRLPSTCSCSMHSTPTLPLSVSQAQLVSTSFYWSFLGKPGVAGRTLVFSCTCSERELLGISVMGWFYWLDVLAVTKPTVSKNWKKCKALLPQPVAWPHSFLSTTSLLIEGTLLHLCQYQNI